jgi:hypothetical protein
VARQWLSPSGGYRQPVNIMELRYQVYYRKHAG